MVRTIAATAERSRVGRPELLSRASFTNDRVPHERADVRSLLWRENNNARTRGGFRSCASVVMRALHNQWRGHEFCLFSSRVRKTILIDERNVLAYRMSEIVWRSECRNVLERALVRTENDDRFYRLFLIMFEGDHWEKSMNVSNKVPARYDLLSGSNCAHENVSFRI